MSCRHIQTFQKFFDDRGNLCRKRPIKGQMTNNKYDNNTKITIIQITIQIIQITNKPWCHNGQHGTEWFINTRNIVHLSNSLNMSEFGRLMTIAIKLVNL